MISNITQQLRLYLRAANEPSLLFGLAYYSSRAIALRFSTRSRTLRPNQMEIS